MPESLDVVYLGPPDLQTIIQEAFPAGSRVHVALTRDEVRQRVESCDAIVDAYMRVHFDEELLAKARRLRVFVVAATGSDHVDRAYLKMRNIPLYTLEGERELLKNLTPAAELSWLLLLACARGLRGAVDDVLTGTWDRNRHPGLMLRGRVLGVVGAGRIGQWMCRYARAFEMECLGYDPYVEPWPDGIRKVSLDELLPRSDFVSIHVPLSEETTGLVGTREFGLMKDGAVLINTSRGVIVDQNAFLRALESGKLRAAGVDVLEGEPDIAGHPLVEYARRHQNLVITPHIGGFSPDALVTVLSFAAKKALGELVPRA